MTAARLVWLLASVGSAVAMLYGAHPEGDPLDGHPWAVVAGVVLFAVAVAAAVWDAAGWRP